MSKLPRLWELEVTTGLQDALNDENQYVIKCAQAALEKITPDQEFMASLNGRVENDTGELQGEGQSTL